MTTATNEPAFEGWAILELMGHRKLTGFVREVSIFGSAMCRIDIPSGAEGTITTQFYNASSIYCMTPTTEDVARRFMARHEVTPVVQYELAPPPERKAHVIVDTFEPQGDDDEGDF